MPIAEKFTVEDIRRVFDATFAKKYGVVLKYGFSEPFYLAAAAGAPAEIQSRSDYLRSALHEIAHWCVAGAERRALDDFGYWYASDGRDAEQQKLFYRHEVLPQAYEAAFCDALGVGFEASADNLAGYDPVDFARFARAVADKYAELRRNGFPERVAQFRRALLDLAE